MLCTCSGEQYKFDDGSQSPESLATRDFSASGISTRTVELESKLANSRVDEVESTLKEALSLNYEEARALLGRLEYEKGNFSAALQVFQGIDIRSLTPRMIKAIVERTRQSKPRPKGVIVPPSVMSMHSVSLFVEAILLKAKSLEKLGQYVDAAKECKIILDMLESALPNGMHEAIVEDCRLQEMIHKSLELLPQLWTKAGLLEEAINAYRRALIKPWSLDPQRLAILQKDLATLLLYGGVEASLPFHLRVYGPNTPTDNIEEAILLLLILMMKVASRELTWDMDIMVHLTYALSITGKFEILANHVEQVLPGIYNRAERWYFLALCYSAAGHNETALNLLKKATGSSEAKHKPHFPSYLLAAKLCSQEPKVARDGINYAHQLINMAHHQYEHFTSQGHKFLGVSYGNAARASVFDSERTLFQDKSLKTLNYAASIEKKDPELKLNLALQNAAQRHLSEAFDTTMMYNNMMAGDSVRGWQLLALILSAEQWLNDAETLVDFALDEAGGMDQLNLLRLKATLQVAQAEPKEAIETYRILLAVIQAQKEVQARNSSILNTRGIKVSEDGNMEMRAWQDLAGIYTKTGSWSDAEFCLRRCRSIDSYSPGIWHTTGLLFKAESMYQQALVSFSVSLSLQPDYVPSIIATAEALMKLGSESLPIAKSFLLSAVQLDPTNHEAWLNLGLVSQKEGFLEQAAEYLQAAYELKLTAPVQSFN